MDNIVQGAWRELKGQVQTTWARLTDDDVKEIEGDFNRLVGKLQTRYGWEKAKAQSEARAWLDKHQSKHQPKE
jgi:uncharacterized protein YjbJ (UPF0337 family)